jgi:lysophospholipid acyltransferase (LPLAT)-like uncharacterized protein
MWGAAGRLDHMLKQQLGNPVLQFLIGRTIGLYMVLVGWSTRWRRVNQAAAEPFWAERGGVIICIWHGRFMLTHKLWKFATDRQSTNFLISQSREGGIAAHAARVVGADVIRGSAPKGGKQKGGLEATREMKRILQGGGLVGITPDGPKGPRMRVKLGAVQIARLTGAPLLPLAWSTRWRITATSWDLMLIPLPFGSGVLVWGDPIHVPAGADAAALEAARVALEAEMLRISAEADRLAGAPLIEPDQAPAAAAPEPVAS